MKLSSLREPFYSLPGPLQRVLAFRLLAALISVILLVACLVFTPGIRLVIPPLISMVYGLFAGSVLFPIGQVGTAFVCKEPALQ